MGVIKKWFPKPKSPVIAPPPTPVAPTPTPIDIPTSGYGGSTIMTGSTGVEQEANVAQTLLGGSPKGKNKMGVYE